MSESAGGERTSNSPGLDAEPTRRAKRGTTNTNVRGNVTDRQRRRAWLLNTYGADVKLTRLEWDDGEVDYRDGFLPLTWWQRQAGGRPFLSRGVLVSAEAVPTARCFHCGTLLHEGTLTVDRIIPGCRGGTYAKNNIRPACSTHNSSLGGAMRRGVG